MSENDALDELADAAGIEPGYTDTWGVYHATSRTARCAVLVARGLPAGSEAEIRDSLARLRAREQAVPPFNFAPAPAWRPHALQDDGRLWGIAVQLYSLRSVRNWGIGDFTDLAELIEGAAELGAAAIGLNPLHALFPTRPEHASPYSPSSRLFLNPLYLDVEAVPELHDCRAALRRVRSREFQARLRELRAKTCVDYTGVAAAKFAVLEQVYRFFRRACLVDAAHPRARAFREFQAQRNPALRRFATFHALGENRTAIDWREWPAQWRDPGSSAVAAFARRHAYRIEFHEYLQWLADWQLRAAAELAHARGMPIGLYGDLAVGADSTGAEAWSDQRTTVTGAAVGAPPDQLNLNGQNWGLPPPDPLAWREQAYAPFIEMLRANMRHAGALRIDHILGLMRLYWVPAGMSAKDGAYVRYPWRELLAVLAAESREQRCLVVGEDLGTVPQGLRESMMDCGLLSYRLLYFERDGDGFRAPDEYPREALVAVGTHDLPPLAAFWHGDDIALRETLGLWPTPEQRDAEQVNRGAARAALADALRRQHLLADDRVPDEAPAEAIYRYLARTPSRLLIVQVEDVLGLRTQINVPGTIDEHPNWRQRLPVTVEELLAHPTLEAVARALNEERGNGRQVMGNR
jgi:(1->4)-alpha-D-glucan 1-alpha-D-glucosylmutase